MKAACSPRGRSPTCRRTTRSSKSIWVDKNEPPRLRLRRCTAPRGGVRPPWDGPAEADMLKLDGINQFYGGSHILRNVGFDAALGEVTVILGRNGVGKTTLLKSLMGVVPVKTGTIRLDGHDITRDTPY